MLRMPQIKQLRKELAQSKTISQYKLMEILNEGLKNSEDTVQISFTAKEVASYFPANYNPEQIKKEFLSFLRKSNKIPETQFPKQDIKYIKLPYLGNSSDSTRRQMHMN